MKMVGKIVTIAICANAAFAICACAPTDIVIAEVSPDAGANADAAVIYGSVCKSSTDCDTDDFCEKNGCGATAGYCHHVPTFCDSSRGPECGCDGVTYWNDCLRKQSAVASGSNGECESGTSCDVGTDCPGTGASCARLLAPNRACPAGPAQNPPPAGVCWHLPPECPSDDDGDPAIFVPCADTSAACQTVCETIRAEAPAVQSSSCHGDH